MPLVVPRPTRRGTLDYARRSNVAPQNPPSSGIQGRAGRAESVFMSYKTLLIVEDSDDIRTRIRTVVAAVPGIEVVAEASDAAGAIEQVERHRPDFITLDLQLDNDSTGLEVLKYLKDRSLSPVVIVLSANVDAFSTESTLLRGANFVLDKVMEFHRLPRILMNEVRASSATAARSDDDSTSLSKGKGTS